MKRASAAVAGATLLAAGIAMAGAGSAAASGTGRLDVYYLHIFFDCNNPSFCGSENLGGFYGSGEMDHNVTTGANTGKALLTGFSRPTFKIISRTSIDVTDWWVGPGSTGPQSFRADEVATITSNGQTQVETLKNDDVGVPAVPGHYTTSQLLGSPPPPNVTEEIDVTFKPAH